MSASFSAMDDAWMPGVLCDPRRNVVAPFSGDMPSRQIMVRTISGVTGEMNLFGKSRCQLIPQNA